MRDKAVRTRRLVLSLALSPGDIYKVRDCLLGFDLPCGEYHTCKSRPCWVADIDGDDVLVYPFTTRTDLEVGPIFEEGEGNLDRDSRLNVVKPPIRIPVDELGPYIGWLRPQYVRYRIEEWEEEEEDWEEDEDEEANWEEEEWGDDEDWEEDW
jgi:hypothetical protein